MKNEKQLEKESRDLKVLDLNKKYFKQTVIATYYQLLRLSGDFNFKYKSVLRSAGPIEMSHVTDTNLNVDEGGRWYEVDEVATDEWQKKFNEQLAERMEKQELREQASEGLIDALKTIGKKTKNK
jgi:hypothetical protein